MFQLSWDTWNTQWKGIDDDYGYTQDSSVFETNKIPSNSYTQNMISYDRSIEKKVCQEVFEEWSVLFLKDSYISWRKLLSFCQMRCNLRQKNGLNLDELPDAVRGVTCYACHNVQEVAGSHNNPLVLAMDGVMRGGLFRAQRWFIERGN